MGSLVSLAGTCSKAPPSTGSRLPPHRAQVNVSSAHHLGAPGSERGPAPGISHHPLCPHLPGPAQGTHPADDPQWQIWTPGDDHQARRHCFYTLGNAPSSEQGLMFTGDAQKHKVDFHTIVKTEVFSLCAMPFPSRLDQGHTHGATSGAGGT